MEEEEEEDNEDQSSSSINDQTLSDGDLCNQIE